MENVDFFAGHLFLIDKPMEWTSFDVVNKVRFALRRFGGIKKIKVGHAGTLDPLATADAETPVDASFPAGHVTRQLVEDVLRNQFLGDVMQVPPMHSAIRIDGHRAYEYARKGREDEVQLKARPITLSELEVVSFEPASDDRPTAELVLRVACSKGTYIRSLARDLGAALGSGAYLTGLRRTRVGSYAVADALSIEEAVDFVASHVKRAEPQEGAHGHSEAEAPSQN